MTKLILIIALAITFTACGGDKAGGAGPKAGGVNLIKCPANWERDGYEYHGFGLCKAK